MSIVVKTNQCHQLIMTSKSGEDPDFHHKNQISIFNG